VSPVGQGVPINYASTISNRRDHNGQQIPSPGFRQRRYSLLREKVIWEANNLCGKSSRRMLTQYDEKKNCQRSPMAVKGVEAHR
jgi:hypothetical protein